MLAQPSSLQIRPKSLSELAKGVSARVVGVTSRSDSSQHLLRRLAEIGFLRGELVTVLRRIAGGEPIAVRIGNSTFALRRHEAECVQVEILST